MWGPAPATIDFKEGDLPQGPPESLESPRAMTVPTLTPIGIIHTPFSEPAGVPIQSVYADAVGGTVVVHPPYADALADLAGFERIWLVYLFHLRPTPAKWKPRVVPFRDRVERGLFATRAPARPNPIGLSVVELDGVHVDATGGRLEVRGVDVVDGTPLLDIKPYVPAFDAWPQSRAGWLDAGGEDRRVADGRFGGSSE